MTEEKNKPTTEEKPAKPKSKTLPRILHFITGAIIAFFILVIGVSPDNWDENIARPVAVLVVALYLMFDKKKWSLGFGILASLGFYFLLVAS